jgi:hypothetical protein
MGINNIEDMIGVNQDVDDEDNEDEAGDEVSELDDPVPDEVPSAPAGGFYGEDVPA